MTISHDARALLTASSGLIVWASCFVSLYGVLSLGCALGQPAFVLGGWPGITWLLAAVWLAHLSVLAWMTWSSWRRPDPRDAAQRFVLRTTLVLRCVGLFASVWIGFPILMIPACGVTGS